MSKVSAVVTISLLCDGATVVGANEFQDLPSIQVTEKKVITSADQLPRRSYRLSRLPSELIDASKSELDEVVKALDADLANDLATLEIQDRATRTQMLQARSAIAMQRGDFPAAQEYLRQIRAEQDKPADKLTSGVLLDKRLHGRACCHRFAGRARSETANRHAAVR